MRRLTDEAGVRRSCDIFLAVTLLVWAVNSTADPVPSRIVSINLCADEMLLALADRDQIASVTWLAHDPTMSWAVEQAHGIPANRGSVEEVLLFEPDLIVAGVWSTPATVAALERLGLPLVKLDHPANLEAVVAQIHRLALAVGRVARGEQVVDEMLMRMRRVERAASPVTALYLQQNGVTTGAGSLADDLLRRAGLTNVAATRTASSYATYSLEALVMDPPDLLVVDDLRGSDPALANQIPQHPVLQRAFGEMRTLAVPGQAWSCGSPFIATAVEMLAAAAVRIANAQ